VARQLNSILLLVAQKIAAQNIIEQNIVAQIIVAQYYVFSLTLSRSFTHFLFETNSIAILRTTQRAGYFRK